MDKKESLLALLDQMDNLITEAGQIEEYGQSEKGLGYLMRRSITAGKLCEAARIIDRAETIERNHPRSLITRQARREADKARQEQAELERIIAEPIEEYKAENPRRPIRIPTRKYQRPEAYIQIYRDPHFPLYLMTEGTEPTK